MFAAIFAAVGHWLVVFALGNINRTKMATNWRITPAARLKEIARDFFIWEFLEDLECAKHI